MRLLTTEGSLANLRALRAGAADVAFVRGGSADPEADGAAGPYATRVIEAPPRSHWELLLLLLLPLLAL